MSILGSILIYPAGGLAYIDALFFGSGAATQSGLNTWVLHMEGSWICTDARAKGQHQCSPYRATSFPLSDRDGMQPDIHKYLRRLCATVLV